MYDVSLTNIWAHKTCASEDSTSKRTKFTLLFPYHCQHNPWARSTVSLYHQKTVECGENWIAPLCTVSFESWSHWKKWSHHEVNNRRQNLFKRLEAPFLDKNHQKSAIFFAIANFKCHFKVDNRTLRTYISLATNRIYNYSRREFTRSESLPILFFYHILYFLIASFVNPWLMHQPHKLIARSSDYGCLIEFYIVHVWFALHCYWALGFTQSAIYLQSKIVFG